MTAIAVDCSNYTSELTTENLQALKDAGVGLVICQSIDPPPGYPAGKTRAQIQACHDAGLAVDAYVWIWFDLNVADIQHKLALLEGLPVRRLWLDVEDVAAAKYDQATTEAKITAALEACDSYATTGKQHTGVYSGRWFWADNRYAANTAAFSDRDLWDANYDDIADAELGFVPYGGWTEPRIKQYRGTSTLAGISGLDLNALSVAEATEVEGGDVTDEERTAMQDTINGLTSALGLLGGDYLKPLTRPTAAKYVKTFVGQARAVCDQFGVNHA